MKHIVMWRIKDENKAENSLKVKELLEGLKDKIDGIKQIEVGINVETSDASYDLVLVSEFESKKALDDYQVNPLHVEVAGFVREIAVSRVVVDYE